MTSVTRAGRTAYGINAVLAGGGFLLVLALSGLGWFGDAAAVGNVYGPPYPAGLAGAWSRMSDTVSYFTEWSNVVVAISTWLLWRAPDNDRYWRRVLRADSLLMITVTAIVYAVLLAPAQQLTGWSAFTNPLQHIVVPAVTVLVFVIWGPRGWFSWRVVAGALVVPVAWIAWMLARGAVVGAYPYDFVDPIAHGYAAVVAMIAKILVFGVVIALLYWVADIVLIRVAGRSAPAAIVE
ncbi:MAG: Pr6Pr family membrane protein [Dermatophilaceae bacterium]